MTKKEDQIQVLQQQLQQAHGNSEAQIQFEKLQQEFQQMQIGYQKSLAEKEKQIQIMQEMHKYDPKLTEFISEYISLNNQLLQQQDILCQNISQWNSFCQESDKITNHVVELQHDYDLTNERVTNYLAWKNTEEGKRVGAPIINDSHKEMLFNNWDAHIKIAEQAVEEAATTASNITDCVNENFHKVNLISETIPGYLPQAQQLQTGWKHKTEENEKSIQGLTKLN